MKKLFLTTILLIAAVIGCVAQKAKNVTVSTPDDFIKAIASNTNITLKTNNILAITSALDKLDKSRDISELDSDEYGSLAPGVYYTPEYDGRSIVIVNINNLTISGVSATATHIQAEPSYADVLKFAYCNNITIKNIKAGHVRTGYCIGDVIEFNQCKNVKVENSDLYGCGVNGLTMFNTDDVTVNNTIIHDCSENSVVMGECNNVTFNKCTMRDCGGDINDWECTNVQYNDCDIEEHEYEGGEYDYDEEYYDGEEDYYDGPDSEKPMPRYLLDAAGSAQSVFSKYLCDDGANGVVYVFLGELEGQVVIPEDCGIYAAFLPQPNDYGEIEFAFLDKADYNNEEAMAFGDSGHILVAKKEGIYSYHIEENQLESVTFLSKDSNGKLILRHGKTKETMKPCTEEVARPHFDFKPTDIKEHGQDHEEYPWG